MKLYDYINKEMKAKSKTIKTLFLIIFAIAAMADLYGILSGNIPRLITKPMVMLSLILYYFMNTTKANITFVIAIFFAWLGDVLLLQGEKFGFFIAGLISFLIMQILYTWIFYQQKESYNYKSAFFTLLIVCYAGFLIYVLSQNSNEVMRVAIILYAISITAMGIFAFRRKVKGLGYWLVLFGSLFFIASDSLLSYNKFVQDFTCSGLAIMGTYIFGQWLIVEGMLR